MKRYLTILSAIALSKTRYFLLNGNLKKKWIKLPKNISGYKFTKDLSNGDRHFAVGKYKNNKKTVVIKIWEGEFKNFHYFSLLHQIRITKILSEISSKNKKTNKLNVYIPKFIDSLTSDERVYLITEYIEANSLEQSNLSEEKMWNVYEKCVSFLVKTGKECSKEQREIITTKTIWDFLILYPFILLAAIISHPELYWKLLSGIPHFLSGSIQLFKKPANSLIHGDLHPGNILINKKGFYILDIEQTRFSYPQYEIITSASLKGTPKSFKEKSIKKLFINTKSKKANVSLTINNCTHNLSGDKNPQGVQSYLWMFDQAMKNGGFLV